MELQPLTDARMHRLTGNCVSKESHRSKDGCNSQVNTGHIFRSTNYLGNDPPLGTGSFKSRSLVDSAFRGVRSVNLAMRQISVKAS